MRKRHSRASPPRRCCRSLAGCDLGLPAGRTPHREGNRLDMVDQPKLKPQRARRLRRPRPTGLMEPPPGTVAVGETPYPYAQNEADRAGAELVNPLQPTPDVHRARQVRLRERVHHLPRPARAPATASSPRSSRSRRA